jgi:hypothetical protein
VGLLAVLVAGVAAVGCGMSDNPASPPDVEPAGLEGTWHGQARLLLELRDDGTGTLRRAGCGGRLTLRLEERSVNGRPLLDATLRRS